MIGRCRKIVCFAGFLSAALFPSAVGAPGDSSIVPLQGAIGTLAAVERVVERDCRDPADDGRCAFVAASRGLENLHAYMRHFRCVSASGTPDIHMEPRYAPMTEHDPGPVLIVKARSLRCAIDPRQELYPVEITSLREHCSRTEWKCSVAWVPDEDRTIALIGTLDSAGSADDDR